MHVPAVEKVKIFGWIDQIGVKTGLNCCQLRPTNKESLFIE